jgi:four helix bundle protein
LQWRAESRCGRHRSASASIPGIELEIWDLTFQIWYFKLLLTSGYSVADSHPFCGDFMTYKRFEYLPVWNAAQDLAVEVFALVEDRAFSGKGDVRDQLQRAGLSISNNIAEGFERGSTAELLCFLYIARGSAGEVRSALRFCSRLAERGLLKSQISDLKLKIEKLIPICESVSRQIRGWADSLQNGDIKGQRHLNEQSKAAYDQVRRTREFMDRLRRVREGEKIDWEKSGGSSEDSVD